MISASKALSLLRRLLKRGGVSHAQWMLTRRCNYRCRGCNVWGDQEESELSTDEVFRGLDILRDLGVIEIVFSGGNPLLREDIGEILDYASERFITTVYDNGSLAVHKMDALRNVDFVAISLDTLDEKKNDYLKGVNGAWKAAMNAVEKLKAEGIPVGVSPTISQVNLYEIIDFTKYFADRNVPVWYCLYWYDYPFKDGMFSIGKRNSEYEIIDRKELARVCTAIMDLKRQYDNIYITDKALEAVKELALTGRRLWRCKALTDFLVVDHKGRVAGCHSREPVASIFELPAVWRSRRFKELRRKYSECTNCAYLCYIFYSLHAGLLGSLGIIKEQWRNMKHYVENVRSSSIPNRRS